MNSTEDILFLFFFFWIVYNLPTSFDKTITVAEVRSYPEHGAVAACFCSCCCCCCRHCCVSSTVGMPFASKLAMISMVFPKYEDFAISLKFQRSFIRWMVILTFIFSLFRLKMNSTSIVWWLLHCLSLAVMVAFNITITQWLTQMLNLWSIILSKHSKIIWINFEVHTHAHTHTH